MTEDLISVSEVNSETAVWNIFMDGFFKRKAEQQMLSDDMSQDAVDTIF